MGEIRITIAAKRAFDDESLLESALNYVIKQYEGQEIRIVSGCINNAEKLAEKYAKIHDYPVSLFSPDWFSHGKEAAVISTRNMLNFVADSRNSGVLLAFGEEENKGVRHAKKKAKEKGIRIISVSRAKKAEAKA